MLLAEGIQGPQVVVCQPGGLKVPKALRVLPPRVLPLKAPPPKIRPAQPGPKHPIRVSGLGLRSLRFPPRNLVLRRDLVQR